jgi:hypothetical protein
MLDVLLALFVCLLASAACLSSDCHLLLMLDVLLALYVC